MLVELRAILSRAEPEDPYLLRIRIRDITHPHEGTCPLCAHIFDAHRAGCPYEPIDAALVAYQSERGKA